MELSARAASIALAHALRHPTRETIGVLLVDEANDDEDDDARRRRVTDAIPLFHGDCDAVVYADAALEQVAAWARGAGRRVAGAYRAAARRGDDAPTATVDGILEAIERSGGGVGTSAVYVALDAASLEALATSDEARAFAAGARGAATLDGAATIERGREADVRALVRRVVDPCAENPLDVFDFDDHLDDLSKDWRNEAFA